MQSDRKKKKKQKYGAYINWFTSPNGFKSRGWARITAGGRNSTLVSHVLVELQYLFQNPLSFPVSLAESWISGMILTSTHRMLVLQLET